MSTPSREPERPVIAIGADHAGRGMKDELRTRLLDEGFTVLDLGTHSDVSCDYPDFAAAVAGAILDGSAGRGVLVCGTGQGMAMSANRFTGIRAAVVLDTFSARASRAHNDSNVLCLGSRVCGPSLAWELVSVWLAASFEGGRHARRVDLMQGLGGS